MKKVLLMFAFIATLCVGSMATAGAQVNYTVYDGTATSSYIPLYGLYCDEYFKCEYVIPADHLDAINGSTISKLTYYLGTSATASWGNANFQVFVKEVASSSISSFSGTDDATIVYQGSLDGTGSTMEINFATPYTYNGGNLLVGIYNTVKGSYKNAYFLGRTISNAAVYGHNSSSLASVTSATAVNFIPKTTFTVDELHGCLTPTNLAVSDVTTYGATVTWTPGNTETNWVVKFNDNEYPVSGTSSYTVTGLTPNTDYVASVKAVCGGSEESEYTTPGVSFTTLPTCPAPTAVTVSNITTNSVDIAWTENGTTNEWTIEANGTEIAAPTNPFTLTGLNPSTNYTVKVKANCDDDDESAWSATAEFRTACGTVVVDDMNSMVEGFEGNDLGCWTSEIIEGTYNWTISTSYPQSGNHSVYFSYSGLQARLISPIMDLTGITTQPRLSFYHRQSSWYGSVDAMDVYYRTAADADWTFLANYSTEYAVMSYDELILPNPTATYQIAFVSNADDNYGIYLDDITVDAAPACQKPTAVTVSNVTAHTADIAWTENGTTNEWTIMLDSTEISATTNPYSLTGLDAATSYTVKVKANCSDDDESDWSAEVSFATPCEAVVVTETSPFTEDFNTLTSGIPNCWDNAEGTTTNSSYKWSYYSTGVTGSCVRFNSYVNSNGNYNLLKTPVLDLTAVTLPVLSFTHKNPSAAGGFEVMYTTDGGATYMTIATGLQGAGAWTTEEIPVSALANNANVMFVFKGTSNYGSGDDYIYLDDVMVYETPTCPKPTAVTVSNITTNSADISWTNGGSENAWVIDLNGTEIPADSNPFTLTGLNPSTRYTVKVKAICSEDDESDWSNEVSFRTECAAYELPFFESFEGGDLGCWTTEATSTSYNWNVSNGSITDYTSLSPADGSYVAYMNSHTRGQSAKLISPVLNLAGVNAPELSFQYLNHAWSGDQNILKVYYRTDATAAWTLLDTFAVDVTAWTEEVISLPNATATYQIAFEAVIDYGYNIVLDAISIIGVSCPAPTNVVVANETENSAEVSWTAGYEETAWNIRYRTIAETVVAYDFENGMQGWNTLNTDGDTLVFVHSSANITGYDYSGLGNNGSDGFAVSNSFIDDMGAVNVNQYFVAPNAITVDSATTVVFHYDYGNDTYPDYFEAGVFTQDPTDATNFTSLWNSSSRGAANAANANVRHTERTRYENWREVTIDLSEYAGQQVWIAFHHQDYDNYELWIDDISIVETAEWTVVNGVTNPYTITDLTANTTYEVQVQAACSEDDASDWTASVEFTTLGETPVVDTCAVPTNVIVENNVATWESEAENFNLTYVVGENATTVEVAGNTYTFEGLEDSTTVSVMVQAICDEDNVSEWSEAVEFVFSTVGINNYSIKANVYPNPAHNVVNVECANIGANLSVYDMFGKVVMTTTISSERTELNFSNVAPGVYMIRIADNNAMTTVKVIKK